MSSLRSNTVTATPHCASVTAAASPFGPEPTMFAVLNGMVEESGPFIQPVSLQMLK
jgi:hypothetical protein